MTNIERLGFDELIKRGVIAGAAGGIAEIAWVSLYAALTGNDAGMVARGVTTAVGVIALLPGEAVGTGVAVHMVLAVLLGVPVLLVWQTIGRRQGVSGAYAAVLAALVGVWAINFFVLLPVISPPFITIVPYAVSLTSKLLFGLAAAETLRRFEKAGATQGVATR
jgi:hypothetical protein